MRHPRGHRGGAGTAGQGEDPLALALARAPGNLAPGMLVTADRGLYGYELCQRRPRRRRGLLLPRQGSRLDLPVLQWLPDGSYRSYIADPKVKNRTANRKRLRQGTLAVTDLPGMHVRVVDYDVPGRGEKNEVITIVASVLDHQDMPAADLAAAYHERWVRHEVAWSEWNSQKEDRLMLVT